MLRKYIPGNPEFIEYTKELPKDTTSQKTKAKAAKGGESAAAKGKVDAAVGKVAEKIADIKA